MYGRRRRDISILYDLANQDGNYQWSGTELCTFEFSNKTFVPHLNLSPIVLQNPKLSRLARRRSLSRGESCPLRC